MIAEYAIIPDVFDPTTYSSEEVCKLRLEGLRDCLMSRCVVRDLHGGGWFKFWEDHRDRWHQRAKELVKKLKQQGRLTDGRAHASAVPATGIEWCNEALASHADTNLNGIISDEATATNFAGNALVCPMPKLTNTDWWIGNSGSIEVKRTSAEYVKVLDPVLRHSNSLMFIDAHLDPGERRYDSVKQLLQQCGTATDKPIIELHRVCYKGSGPTRIILSEAELRTMFSTLSGLAQQANLGIEVFIWDDFHDRYLISNLIGVSMPNGFDVDMGTPSLTRWSRLDRTHRDNVQREFDPSSQMHAIRHQFTI